jgi:hypothetical protein
LELTRRFASRNKIDVELGRRPHALLQHGVVDVNAEHPVPVGGEAVPYGRSGRRYPIIHGHGFMIATLSA